ncbi:hypothetical protein [Pontibacter burrus]|uniref:Uncharacterized protein n=1 Tax=Pontibacter burrus TaxID=2704466 RepID=A0A6B3LT47_9BACT|nr:hypothetical protein [Pontibacter burrus]NEM96650.1 hypothetical protein [Pontibacter burrus]
MNIKLINFKFIAIHVLASLLMILAARELYLFYKAHFIEAAYLYSNQTDKFFEHIAAHEGNSNDPQVIFNYFYGRFFSGLGGLLLSTSLSWWLSRKSGVHSANIFLVGLLGFSLLFFIQRARFDLHQIINYFFDTYRAIGVRPVLLVHAILLTLLSSLIFFYKNQKPLA